MLWPHQTPRYILLFSPSTSPPNTSNPSRSPGIPTHPNFSSHRLWALNHMTALFRHWSRKNYTLGLSGHISLRDPEYPSLFWMNPLAIHFGLLKASDMLLLSDRSDDAEGGEVILAGNARGRPANKAGWAIHAAIHRQRGDVNAACHAHTENGVAWSATAMAGDATERKLSMINQDACTFYGDALAVYGNYGGVVVGSALGEGEAIAEALGQKGKAAILLNHGLLSVGQTVDEAGFLFGLLERSCGVELKARNSRCLMNTIGDKEAEFNFRMASTPVSTYVEEENASVDSMLIRGNRKYSSGNSNPTTTTKSR